MTKKKNLHLNSDETKPPVHIDDLMCITVEIELRAKGNVDGFHCGTAGCMPASECVEYLETVIKAIKERRLYGWVCQESAQAAVETGEFVEE